MATLELKMMIHILMPDLTVHFNMLIKKSCKFSCPKWVTSLLYGQTEEDNFKDIIHFLNMSIKINLKLRNSYVFTQNNTDRQRCICAR